MADLLEPVLNGVDVPQEHGGVRGRDDRLDTFDGVPVHIAGASGLAAGRVVLEHARPRGPRRVVHAFAPAFTGLLVPDGLAGRGEQVQQRVRLGPQQVQEDPLLVGVVAPVERELPDDVVVARLDGGLVVLAVRPASGLLDVPGEQVVDELVVDELGAVVRVEAGDGEREQGDGMVHGLPDVAFGVVAHADVHGPVGRVVDHGQGPGELAGRAGPAVGDRVGLHEPGQAFDLVGGLPDADRVAHVLGRGPGQRHAPRHGGPFQCPQPPVDGRCAHRRDLVDLGLRDAVQLPVGLQRGYPLAEHGLHVRPARHAHEQPEPFQQALRVPRIPGLPSGAGFAFASQTALAGRPRRFPEQPSGGGPAHADLDQTVEDELLLLLRGLRVFVLETVREPSPGGHVESTFHKASIPAGPSRRAVISRSFFNDEQTRITRSKNTMNVDLCDLL